MQQSLNSFAIVAFPVARSNTSKVEGKGQTDSQLGFAVQTSEAGRKRTDGHQGAPWNLPGIPSPFKDGKEGVPEVKKQCKGKDLGGLGAKCETTTWFLSARGCVESFVVLRLG